MRAIASQITSVTIVCSIVCSGTDQRKHQSSTSLAFVRGINRWPVNSPHKEPVTRKMFPFDDVIMCFDNGISSGNVGTTIARPHAPLSAHPPISQILRKRYIIDIAEPMIGTFPGTRFAWVVLPFDNIYIYICVCVCVCVCVCLCVLTSVSSQFPSAPVCHFVSALML